LNLKATILLPFIFGTWQAWAQDIELKGSLADHDDGSPVVGAVVMLVSVKDTTDVKGSTSDGNGLFVIKDLVRGFYRLKIRNLAYQPYAKLMRVTATVDIGRINLTPDIRMLDEVKVKGAVVPVEIKGDTVLYNADAFKVNPDATAADLVSKMPGIQVTDQGVEAGGEAVEQVLLDGKRFFGQDPLLALNTIPAEVVNQVEGSFNQRKKSHQFTLLGMSNDVNQKSFTDSDILGAGSGGGRRGRFFGGSQSGNNQPKGITLTQSVGANYSKEWENKGQVEMSYFFDRSKFENVEQTKRESFFNQGSQLYNEVNSTNSNNLNHRFNMRLEYSLSPKTSIVFRPNLSFQDNENNVLTAGQTTVFDQITGETINNFGSEATGITGNGDLQLRHKLNEEGRSLIVNFGTGISDFNLDNFVDDQLIDSTLLYLDGNSNYNYETELTYIEPIGLSGQFQAEYSYSNGTRTAERETYSYNSLNQDMPTLEVPLSNRLQSGLIQHTPSVSYSQRGVQTFFRGSIAYENTSLGIDEQFPNESSGTRYYNVILPMAMSRLQLGGQTSLFFRYATQTTAPTATQLQELVDNSNPLFFSMGNKALDQSYSHTFFARISKTNPEKSTSLSNFTFVRGTSNYITNATFLFRVDTTLSQGVILPAGTQLSRPVNLDGFWNLRNNTSYSFPLSKLKTNVNFDLGFAYNRRPGMANNIENVSNTYTATVGLALNSNISENVDYTLSYTPNFNTVTNSIQESQTSGYLTHVISGKLNLIFLNGTVFRSDFSYQIYDGISGEFDTQYFLWNLSLAKKFLKNDVAEIAVTVFDLLDQNTGISQTVTSNFIEESQSQVLQQYLMVSLRYNLRKFKAN